MFISSLPFYFINQVSFIFLAGGIFSPEARLFVVIYIMSRFILLAFIELFAICMYIIYKITKLEIIVHEANINQMLENIGTIYSFGIKIFIVYGVLYIVTSIIKPTIDTLSKPVEEYKK